MIKLFKRFSLLIVIGLILLVAPNFIGQQGYVLVSLGNYTLEGSVIQFVSVFLLLSVAAYCLWLLIRYLIVFVILPSKWLNNRHEKNHANYFQVGLDFMANGQWHQAAEQFLKVKRLSRIETAQQLALVSAIRANDPKLLSNIQDKVDVAQASSQLATLILACQQQDYEKAQSTIDTMKVNVLKQELPFKQAWMQVQIHTFNWLEIKKQLPKLNKQIEKMATDSASPAIKELWLSALSNHFTEAFRQFTKTNSVNQLLKVWQQFSKPVQQISPISTAYVQVLAEQKQLKLIEQVLLEHEKVLGEEWLLQNLRNCYSFVKRLQMEQLFNLVQKKLNKQPKNKALLTAYAYLATGQKDNQLAKQALEQVIFTDGNRQDKVLYANVLAELGEVRHSLDVYQKLH
ncbi:MAG: hypothetical protein HWE10_04870 [Gammaproteobacteria bacterium]|nr:hypothetical protein [Gammaproteobacteria bacterium]